MPTHRSLPTEPTRTERPGIELTRGQRIMRVLDNLFSFRTIFSCLVVAAIPAYLWHFLWVPLATIVFWPSFVLLWLLVGFSPRTVRKCPFCRKRVKVGATVCAHCGRRVV